MAMLSAADQATLNQLINKVQADGASVPRAAGAAISIAEKF